MTALLLAACLSMPNFDTDGATCPDTQEACRCSECVVWDATPGAVRYEVQRETVSTGNKVWVGIVRWRSWTDDDGTANTTLPNTWCAAMDSPFPREDTLYRYRIRACDAVACGEFSDPVTYRAAPYACFDGGREVACYVGDSVVSR